MKLELVTVFAALLASVAAEQAQGLGPVGSEENAIQYGLPSAAAAGPYAAPAPVPPTAGQDGVYYQLTPYSTQTGQQGLHVSTGYDGYVVPQEALGGHSLDLGLLTIFKLLGVKFLPKFLPLAGGLLLLLLLGGALTTAVCAFTPFCSLTLFPFGRTATETVRSYLTPDRLTQTTGFVLDAVDKYTELARRVAADKERKRRR